MLQTLHPTKDLIADLRARKTAVAVIGLGYVGFPLAQCLSRKFQVIGFDANEKKLAKLREEKNETGMQFSSDVSALAASRFIVVAVPTPVDGANRPDLTPLRSVCTTISKHLKPGTVVVFESTVYPGATEEVCAPILEQSGLVAGKDFFLGYSPERINPGDKVHTVDSITKVVSGSDSATLEVVAAVYGDAIGAGVYRAPSIKVAEAAKVIENTQRDLNIALINELALIFHRLGLDTQDVLDTAGTKWNFLPFRPGLVGGHCIAVDPYYLTHKAEEVGYHPQVILAGRRINDGMGSFVAQECIRMLIQQKATIKGAKVLILGLTFKEDVGDVRNTKVVDVIAELRRFGLEPVVTDPVADAAEAQHEYGITLLPAAQLPKVEAIIAAVSHAEFKTLSPSKLAGLCPRGAPFLDLKSAYDRDALAAAGFSVWRL